MQKTILKGYRFRIYPDEEQAVFFSKSFGCCRFVWNYFLNERKEFYLKNKDSAKKGLNYHDNARSLVTLKQNPDFVWLNEVNSQSLQQSLRCLDVAYTRFFKKQAAFPVFKKRNENQSFCVPQNFAYADSQLWIPKLKTAIKVRQHREFGRNSEICFVTISKTKSDKYFVSFTVEEKIIVKKNGGQNKIGIDLGLDSLITFSNGHVVKNPKIVWKQRKKLKYRHKQLSKKQKGSKNRQKARLKLAKTYEKITNAKQDFTHKLTSQIVKNQDIIVCEDLNVCGMMKNRRLARSIGEVSWYELTRQLKYKSEWNNKTFVQVNRYFPSSKTCNCCGYINQELRLDNREWTCKQCQTTHNRDVNAAINILHQGLIALTSGEGLPSESKRKLREASEKVSVNSGKNTRVYELRSPGIYSGE